MFPRLSPFLYLFLILLLYQSFCRQVLGCGNVQNSRMEVYLEFSLIMGLGEVLRRRKSFRQEQSSAATGFDGVFSLYIPKILLRRRKYSLSFIHSKQHLLLRNIWAESWWEIIIQNSLLGVIWPWQPSTCYSRTFVPSPTVESHSSDLLFSVNVLLIKN